MESRLDSHPGKVGKVRYFSIRVGMMRGSRSGIEHEPRRLQVAVGSNQVPLNT